MQFKKTMLAAAVMTALPVTAGAAVLLGLALT